MSYEPGTYVKGDRVRVCMTLAQSVDAEWHGYRRQVDAPESEVDETSDEVDPLDEPTTAPEVEAPNEAFDPGLLYTTYQENE